MNASGLTAETTKALVQEIEDDLARTEEFPENISVFSPVLWLDSVDRKYVIHLNGLSTLNQTMPVTTLVHELMTRLQRLIEPGGATILISKCVMVLSYLIEMLAFKYMPSNIHVATNMIVEMQLYTKDLGVAQTEILTAIDALIRRFVLAGANPVSGIMTNDDIFVILKNLPSATNSAETFRSVMARMPDFLPRIAIEQRGQFVEQFYTFMAEFAGHNPKAYEEILNGADMKEAPVMIEAIMKWKLTLDTEYVNLLVALMPLNTNAVITDGRKGVFSVILKAMEDFKQKKEPLRLSVANAFLELEYATFIRGPKAYVIMTEFLNKFKVKFESWMFKKKKEHRVSGRLLSVWLPRYAAIELAMRNGIANSPAMGYLLGLFDKDYGWDVIATFLKHVFRGYPRTIQTGNLQDTTFQQLSVNFSNALENLGKGKKTHNAEATAVLIARFLAIDPYNYSMNSSLTLKDVRAENMIVPEQLGTFRSVNISITLMNSIIGNLIKIIAQMVGSDVQPFINFARMFMTCDDLWSQQLSRVSNEDAVAMLSYLAVQFKEQVVKALYIASPSITSLGFLFYRFLKWSEMVIRETFPRLTMPLSEMFLESVVRTILLLRAVSSENTLMKSEAILERIMGYYNMSCMILPSNIIVNGGEIMKYVVKCVLGAWLNMIKKQMELEKKIPKGIPALTTENALFPTSRERVASIGRFLCEHIIHLADQSVKVDATSERTLDRVFFDVIFYYILNSDFVDERLTESFASLSGGSFRPFMGSLKGHVDHMFKRGKDHGFDKTFYWINIINVLKSLLKSGNGTQEQKAELIIVVLQFIPTFITMCEMDIFDDQADIFLSALYKMLVAFPVISNFKSSSRWKNIVHISLELCLKYQKESKKKLVLLVMERMPTILDNVDFAYTRSINHVEQSTADIATYNDIAFVVATCESLILADVSNTVTKLCQKCLDNVIRANRQNAWRVYFSIARTAKPLVKSMLIDSMTLLFHTMFSSKKNGHSRVDMVDDEDARRYCIAHQSRTYPNAIIRMKSHDSLHQLLTKDDFQIFKDPISYELDFIEAAVTCCFAFNVHDRLFTEMTRLYRETNQKLAEKNPCSLFFTGWFNVVSKKWKLSDFITYARYSAVDTFVNAIDPPLIFVYYMKLFGTLTNGVESIAELLIECFFRPLILFPSSYGLPLSCEDLNVSKFMNEIMEYPGYQNAVKQIFSAQTYYQFVELDMFDNAVETFYHYMLRNAPGNASGALESRQSMASTMNTKNPFGTADYSKVVESKWITSLGKSSIGHAVLVVTGKAADVSYDILMYHFLIHIPIDAEKIDIFVDVQTIPQHFIPKFKAFLKTIDSAFTSKVKRITILNATFASVNIIKTFPANKFASLIRFANDLDGMLGSEKIFLPKEYFDSFVPEQVWLPVWAFNMQCKMYICDNMFRFTGDMEIYGQTVQPFVRVPVLSISKIDVAYDNVVITTGSQTINMICTPPIAKLIVTLWESMKPRDLPRANICYRSLIKSMSPSMRIQCVVMCVFMLAKDRSLAVTPLLELLEAALKNRVRPCINLDIIKDGENLELGKIGKEIAKAEILDETVLYLAEAISVDDFDAVYNLLDLFADFMNSSQNVCAITKVCQQLLLFSRKLSMVSILERFLWLKIESQTALECIVPLVIGLKLPPLAIRRILKAMSYKNPDVVGKIVARHCLDGSIRRKAFGNYISPEKIFNAITTLPFSAPQIVMDHMGIILFCMVAVGLHAEKEVSDDIRSFFDCAMRSIEQSLIDRDLGKLRDQLLHSLSNAKVLDGFAVINTVDSIADMLGPEVLKEYREALTEPRPEDNPDVWYIQASASVFFDKKKQDFASRFMAILPSMLLSNLGFQKLIMAFRTLGELMEGFPRESKVPICLFWSAVVASLHPNSLLRNAALKLMQKIVIFVGKSEGFSGMRDFLNGRSYSNSLEERISACEREISVDFKKNFAYAFIQTLTRSIQEPDTRKNAADLLKICISHVGSNPRDAVIYALPCIAFADEEPTWILTAVETESQTIPEFVMENFRLRTLSEIGFIISYMSEIFGERHSAHKLEQLADCIMCGAKLYPDIFACAKEKIVMKCLDMMEKESNAQKKDKIASVAGCFLILPSKAIEGIKLDNLIDMSVIREDSIMSYLSGMINGIAQIMEQEI